MAHLWTPDELVFIDSVFRLVSKAMLDRLQRMTEVVNDTWQAQLSRSGYRLHDKKAWVHEAVILYAIEDDLCHGDVLNVARIIIFPLFLRFVYLFIRMV